MTSVNEMYKLQEVDLQLDRVREQLGVAEEERLIEVSIENLDSELQAEEARLKELEAQQRDIQHDADVRRERFKTLEEQLNDGSITNSRSLESLEQEVVNIRQQIVRDEIVSQDLSVKAEESQLKCAHLNLELQEIRSRWEVRQVELNDLVERLTAERNEHETQREAISRNLDQAALQQYDTLRQSKRGKAVARVEQGLCQACRILLPTALRQRVRLGRQIVNCSSCGRLLLPG